MNRLLFFAALACFCLAPAWAAADCGCDPCCQPTCCQPACCTTTCQTCCRTTYRTVVTCRPVTTYRRVTYRDACGCCRTRCVPCTRMVRVCQRVPVTECCTVARTFCQPACNSCATGCDPCATVARSPRGWRARRLARRQARLGTACY